MTAEGLLPGFRLARLELYNWGTFDARVWSLRTGGRNALVTGDIGSGKSTIVDALTTLLLPANRISYNKAAGAESKERSLRSYVLGHYKSEQDETTGTTRPVALRNATKFSVILGVFTNEGYAATVTLAQVFWMKNGDTGGQPDRYYVTADSDLSVSGDFADFGGDMNGLRRRLKARDGVRVHDAFPEYGRDFRRRLGIESEQALELFHQTVSMKAVGNLTDFVRAHMLEPFNAAKATADIVAHFEDLTRAHEAVQRAHAQLAALTPLLKDCDGPNLGFSPYLRPQRWKGARRQLPDGPLPVGSYRMNRPASTTVAAARTGLAGLDGSRGARRLLDPPLPAGPAGHQRVPQPPEVGRHLPGADVFLPLLPSGPHVIGLVKLV
jgi:uncharacterized protein YPO0396